MGQPGPALRCLNARLRRAQEQTMPAVGTSESRRDLHRVPFRAKYVFRQGGFVGGGRSSETIAEHSRLHRVSAMNV